MRRIFINVKQKTRAFEKCVGDASCKYKLFGIMTPIEICFIAGFLITFASPKGVLGADMAENHYSRRLDC